MFFKAKMFHYLWSFFICKIKLHFTEMACDWLLVLESNFGWHGFSLHSSYRGIKPRCDKWKLIVGGLVANMWAWLSYRLFFFFLRFYLFERESMNWERSGRRGIGRSRLPTEQGAWCRSQSQDPEIITWTEVRLLTHWSIHPGTHIL